MGKSSSISDLKVVFLAERISNSLGFHSDDTGLENEDGKTTKHLAECFPGP